MTIRPIRLAATLLAALVLAAGASAAEPEERRLALDDQTGVAVTIYNQDLALVRDSRTARIEAGVNRLAFVDVSAQIRPETALLRSEGGRLSVIEQNFDFDLLTPEKLLEKSVGSKVRLIRSHPTTGEDTVEEEAELLSIANGIVLKIGQRIETAAPGRIVFAEVPANLRARPTLVLTVESAEAGQTPLELSYLTGGLSWQADYVAKLTPDESRLDLSGLVTLTNTSGTGYREARLQLVAGDVHQVLPALAERIKMMATAPGVAAAPMAEEALFEYHLYTLARPTTIAENQTKQVALLSAEGVPVSKEYRFVDLGNAYDYQAAEPRRVSALVRIAFDNAEAAHLGQPLPQGIVRVYKDDSAGQALFVGEDAIEHTPKGEAVRLDLGRAFDVTATSRQTEFERVSDRVIEVAFEVELKNAKTAPVTVAVVEQIPGEWKMLEESHPHEKTGAFQARWDVPIPAEGKTVLAYRLRIGF